jgi:hypothetical protein
MDNYQTPVRKKKPRILGMTIIQIGLLAGMIVVQLVILVLALKYIVFAPKDDIPPAVTPIAVAPVLQPTLIPTPVLDLSSAVLTIDDLPAGFVSAPDESDALDFNEMFPKIDFHPVNKFTLFELQEEQLVVGWTFVFTTPEQREDFDILITHPNEMFYTDDTFEENPESLEVNKLGKSSPIGELSTGWTGVVSDLSIADQADMVLFSYKNYGGVVMVFYDSKDSPVIDVWEVAHKLDNRILDVWVNGPIPTPVVIAFDALAGVQLTQEDLPAGFQAIPEAELALDEASRSEMETVGMRVAGVFGFRYEKPNAEETVLGFTFQFTSTLGKVVMDQMLAGDELLDAMFPPTPTQRRQPLTVNKPIGDRALATAIMEMGEAGGIRCDVLVFRREYAGVVLFHIYHTGIRQTNVETLALKLDAKIQALASP